MASQGDFLQVKVKQLLGGTRNIENIFHFRPNVGAPTVEALSGLFTSYVIPAWRAFCPTVLTFAAIQVLNLFDLDEYSDIDLGGLAGTGSATVGEQLPGFVAAACKMPNDRHTIRDSSKRLYVGGETVLGGDLWDETWLSSINSSLGSLMGDDLTDTATDPDTVYRPITVRRIANGLDSKGRQKYRLPIDQAEGDWGNITSFTVQPVATSQVTRRGSIES